MCTPDWYPHQSRAFVTTTWVKHHWRYITSKSLFLALIVPFPRLDLQYVFNLYLINWFSLCSSVIFLPFTQLHWLSLSFSFTFALWSQHFYQVLPHHLPPPLRIKPKATDSRFAHRDHHWKSAFLNICSLKCLSQLDLTQMFESQAEFQLPAPEQTCWACIITAASFICYKNMDFFFFLLLLNCKIINK